MAIGWFRGQVLENEPMPNSGLSEIDKMEYSEYYQEFVDDMAACGSNPSSIPSQATWRSIWKAQFPNLVMREFRSVDSKDNVRAFLRALLRRTKTYAERRRIKNLRKLYWDSIRQERGYYWHDRVLPVHYPNEVMTFISDGAAQDPYHIPRNPNHDHGRDVCQFKVVGNIFHGHCY